MQKIIPHLWFDTKAKEAAEFYTSLFPDSAITHHITLHNTPSGDTDVVSYHLSGYSFMALNGGPAFKLNPSISLMINFDPSRDPQAKENLDKLWNKLADGGQVLMELQKYPFSEWYGWIQDKYGLSWQLILTDPTGEERPLIIPSLLFTQKMNGKAEAAIRFYQSIFKNSKLGKINYYGSEQKSAPADHVAFADFMLEGQWFAAMDGGTDHKFSFNEAISLLVNCQDQAEIDYYWEKLSAVPESEQCGWLKDKFGISWQISPADLERMMDQGTPEQIDRITQAFLQMKKLNLAELETVFAGK